MSDELRPWLRHHVWCNCKTDDPPNTERCKCGLRAALAARPDSPIVHVNDGSAHDRAMAWSEGHTAGYEEGLAARPDSPTLDGRDAVVEAARDLVAEQRLFHSLGAPSHLEEAEERLRAALAAFDAAVERKHGGQCR